MAAQAALVVTDYAADLLTLGVGFVVENPWLTTAVLASMVNYGADAATSTTTFEPPLTGLSLPEICAADKTYVAYINENGNQKTFSSRASDRMTLKEFNRKWGVRLAGRTKSESLDEDREHYAAVLDRVYSYLDDCLKRGMNDEQLVARVQVLDEAGQLYMAPIIGMCSKGERSELADFFRDMPGWGERRMGMAEYFVDGTNWMDALCALDNFGPDYNFSHRVSYGIPGIALGSVDEEKGEFAFSNHDNVRSTQPTWMDKYTDFKSKRAHDNEHSDTRPKYGSM